MKAISGSIVVLAGAIILVAGTHIQHNDTQVVISAIGCCVGSLGLFGWWREMAKPD